MGGVWQWEECMLLTRRQQQPPDAMLYCGWWWWWWWEWAWQGEQPPAPWGLLQVREVGDPRQ